MQSPAYTHFLISSQLFFFISSCSDVLVSKLTKTKNQIIEHNGILATKLCTHKENVNQINEIHLSRLSGDKKVFQASDSDSGMSTMLDSQVPVRQTIELKEGAQVRVTDYDCVILRSLVSQHLKQI